AVLLDQALVRELGLRVPVPPLHPGVCGGGVQVPPVLLGVLAVVPLRAGQPEDALFQDGVAPVPEGQGEAQGLADVADPGQAVLAPPVRAGAGVIVGEGVPGRSSGAVVLADSPPGPLRQIRTPLPPWFIVRQSFAFG